jgi:hypothetical protein
MQRRQQSLRLWSSAGLTLVASLACQLDTVELRSVAAASESAGAAGNPAEADAPEPVSSGTSGSAQTEGSAGNPLTTPTDFAPDADNPPDVDYYQPLPDAVDLPPLPERGCRNVDFLFVVDNSLSMVDEQDNLVQSFGGFMRVVQDTLEAQDFHIMAVDTDDRGIGLGGVLEPPLSGSSCDSTFGAGRRQSASGQDCGINGSSSFMTEAQADLEGAFSCAARVGTFGDVLEQPMTSLLSAVSSELNAPGGCNEGFSREDAILVVTFITDEDDVRSPGDPSAWRDQLVAAKGGDESAVVVLGLVGDTNVLGGLPGGPCLLTDASAAPRLQQFVRSLPHGSLGSVCAADYAPFLASAATEIDAACRAFVPPPLR